MDIYSLEQIGQAPKQGCLLMYTRKKVIFEKYDCTGTDIKEYIVSKVNMEKEDTMLELHLFDTEREYRAVQSTAHRTYPGSAKGTAECVVTKEESQKDDIDEYVEDILLEKKFKQVGSRIRVINYMKYDENGMAEMYNYRHALPEENGGEGE